MLLTERMKEKIFSPSEEAIIHYMFDQQGDLRQKTTKQIAAETYTHPSTLIRVAKKLGYQGWVDLRNDFNEEINYLNTHFEDIDANYPFEEEDTFLTIAHKIAALKQTTISDTLSLLNKDELEKAAALLNHAKEIKIYAINNNLFLCHDFKSQMTRIGKTVHLCTVDQGYEAANSDSETCTILISYTGETKEIVHLLPILESRKTPIIVLTSIGDNTFTKQADCVLRMATREKMYSKIGSFSSTSSISFLLDTLYSCVFSQDYRQNLDHKITISKYYDQRQSFNKVIDEE